MARGAAGANEAKFLASGEFYVIAPSVRLSRQPDGSLRETQSVGGLPLTHRRLERWRPSADELAALAGRYHSDEIDSTYDLAVDGDGLTLSALRFEPLKLTPADRDAFDSPMLRMNVVRDSAGAPTGFTVAAGRVKGLPFRKLG
jgi:hypothetical protein